MVSFVLRLHYPEGCPVLVKHYLLVRLWGCIWKRLAFHLVDGVKRSTVTNVEGRHPTHLGPERNKKVKDGWILSFVLSWDVHLHLLSDIRTPGFRLSDSKTHPSSSWFSGLRLGLIYTTGFPGSPACRQQTVGLLGPHNRVSRFLYKSPYILLALFLQRTLTNTEGKHSQKWFLKYFWEWMHQKHFTILMDFKFSYICHMLYCSQNLLCYGFDYCETNSCGTLQLILFLIYLHFFLPYFNGSEVGMCLTIVIHWEWPGPDTTQARCQLFMFSLQLVTWRSVLHVLTDV